MMFLSERPVSYGKKPKQSRLARLLEDEVIEYTCEDAADWARNHPLTEAQIEEMQAREQRQQRAIGGRAVQTQNATPRSTWDY